MVATSAGCTPAVPSGGRAQPAQTRALPATCHQTCVVWCWDSALRPLPLPLQASIRITLRTAPWPTHLHHLGHEVQVAAWAIEALGILEDQAHVRPHLCAQAIACRGKGCESGGSGMERRGQTHMLGDCTAAANKVVCTAGCPAYVVHGWDTGSSGLPC